MTDEEILALLPADCWVGHYYDGGEYSCYEMQPGELLDFARAIESAAAPTAEPAQVQLEWLEMKLWRCSWVDDSEGNMLAWGTTKAKAKQQARAGGMDTHEHEPFFITYKLPLNPHTLVDWLNVHVQKDNG